MLPTFTLVRLTLLGILILDNLNTLILLVKFEHVEQLVNVYIVGNIDQLT